MEIKFNKILTFLGKNGWLKQSGVEIFEDNYLECVRIYPITSKNERARCFIEYPYDKIQELIDELKKYKK